MDMNKSYYQRGFESINNNKWLFSLFIIFFLEFIFLAISPISREDWLLENALVFVFFIFVLFNYKKFKFSKMSWSFIFVFLFIHEIGAHYTYSEVPYESFLNSILGFNFNDYMGWLRNHFDRLAHFTYGLLIILPLQEICSQVSRSVSGWTYFVALNIVMSTSLLFELFEWGAAWLFGGELGIAYLGTQGDVWDAQQDMLLSIVGALLTLLIRLIVIKISLSFKNIVIPTANK
jgi:putative membrane protein